MAPCANTNPEQRRAFISQIPLQAKKVRQCEHIKASGEFCGSPALRGRRYCYFHLTHIGRRLRAERVHAQTVAASAESNTAPLDLPPFEDAGSIQIALMQVVDAILHNRLDTKRAGLVLYALQTASCNLNNGAAFEPHEGSTVAGRYEDFEDDFRLGDSAPQLKVDEDEAIEEMASEHAADLVKIEELAEAYARLDEAENTSDEELAARQEAGENVDALRTRWEGLEERGAGFSCNHVDRFFCRIMGPLSKANQAGPEPEQMREREAVSQRLELLPDVEAPERSGRAAAHGKKKKAA
jgi:hypothetical protein